MPQSPSGHSSSSSVLSDSTQPSSTRSCSNVGRASPVSELAELSYKEIKALKQYSHSVQNFTYQLFENFRLEQEAKGRPSPPVQITDPSHLSQRKNYESRKEEPDHDLPGFRSTELLNDNNGCSPRFDNLLFPQPLVSIGRRKPSDLPRRKKRPGSDFPEDIGL
ncbi:uncharacterized protein VP01_714g4 [Puccinia sorghi]|uniref:Uncharacterized protein n=1 Tax=Puccinia sorghi TaxID=27349 RepID=A0A0L6UDI6_9BASI|nr:uncharacterized protein VP01_714g4 [Puccinia sorghi]